MRTSGTRRWPAPPDGKPPKAVRQHYRRWHLGPSASDTTDLYPPVWVVAGSSEVFGGGSRVVGRRSTGTKAVSQRPDDISHQGDAAAFLAMVETGILRGTWVDPSWGRVTLGSMQSSGLRVDPTYAPGASSSTVASSGAISYQNLGCIEMGKLRPSQVRSWFGRVAKEHPASAAGAYRLLRAIFNTALRDELDRPRRAG